jgi:hypothetical protein
MSEDDVPIRRRAPAPDKTEFVDAATRPHRSAMTEQLPSFGVPEPPPSDVPVRLIRPPTERIDPPTSRLPVAPLPEEFEASDPFDRVAHAAGLLRQAGELLDVDRRPIAAQICAGIAAGLGNAPTQGAIEYVGARIVQRLLLADAGVGGRMTEEQLGQALIAVATEIIAGVDPHRRAIRAIALANESKAAQYRKIAETARARGDALAAAGWETRADEREAHARELRREAR